MECPRCQTELENGSCGKCGWSTKASAAKSGSSGEGGLFGFSIESRREPVAETSKADWRVEIQDKLRSHREKSHEKPAPKTLRKPKAVVPLSRKLESPPRPSKEAEVAAAPEAAGQADPRSPSTFDYRLADDDLKPRRTIVLKEEMPAPSQEAKSEPNSDDSGELNPDAPPVLKIGERTAQNTRASAERPVIRRQLQNRPEVGGMRQGVLSLGRAASVTEPRIPVVSEPLPEAPEVPMEVVFSRVLAGIFDFILAGLTGLAFAAAASLWGGVEPFSQPFLQLGALVAVTLHLVNSIFFLTLLHQTPGMIWTELTLGSEPGEVLSFGKVVARTLLFWVTVASILGLLVGLFDGRRRCLHDRLSGTWVAPVGGAGTL